MTLSIITINYNNLYGLMKTYESIVNQTFNDYEWILIDGGSSDGSREFIEAHQDNFVFWCSEKDNGVYDAMNKGIQHCNGDYINHMNSGDTFFESTTLEKIFKHNISCEIVYGDWIECRKDIEIPKHFPYPIEIYTLYRRNICHQAMLIKTSWMKKFGYDENLKILADYKLWIDMALAGARFQFVDLVVCKYEIGGMSNNGTNDQLIENELKIINNNFPEAVINTIKEYDYYVRQKSILRTRYLIEKSRFTYILTKGILVILDKLFLHVNLNHSKYDW